MIKINHIDKEKLKKQTDETSGAVAPLVTMITDDLPIDLINAALPTAMAELEKEYGISGTAIINDDPKAQGVPTRPRVFFSVWVWAPRSLRHCSVLVSVAGRYSKKFSSEGDTMSLDMLGATDYVGDGLADLLTQAATAGGSLVKEATTPSDAQKIIDADNAWTKANAEALFTAFYAKNGDPANKAKADAAQAVADSAARSESAAEVGLTDDYKEEGVWMLPTRRPMPRSKAALAAASDAANSPKDDVKRSAAQKASALAKAAALTPTKAMAAVWSAKSDLKPTDSIAKSPDSILGWLEGKPIASRRQLCHGRSRRGARGGLWYAVKKHLSRIVRLVGKEIYEMSLICGSCRRVAERASVSLKTQE